MNRIVLIFTACSIGHLAVVARGAAPRLAEEQAALAACQIKSEHLKPLRVETALVKDGKAEAVICHANEPAWREAAAAVQRAIAQATGVTLTMKMDRELSPEEFAAGNALLIGHLDNHRHVARQRCWADQRCD